MAQYNVLGRRRVIAALIDEGCIDERVVSELLPGGTPLPDEDLLWDYKETLPTLGLNPTSEEKLDYAYKMGEIVKDTVAFYNTYGGYLLIGVADNDRVLQGYQGKFDANDLCKKVHGATRQDIDVKFALVSPGFLPANKSVGLLYIPQRPRDRDPVQFVKDAPPSKAGKKAYSTNDIYMRSGEECRRAVSAADLTVLFNRDRFGGASSVAPPNYIENNLPAKDPSLIEFVGREKQLEDLWRWFIDRYTAVKLLSGSGGVGKTSIAWTFCDAVSRNPPVGLEKVVWLTAKRRTYTALRGEYLDITHTHFSDLASLMRALLGELGVPDDQLPKDMSREDLIDECITVVRSWPCLLVVDDIDSLPNEEQYDVFRTISTIFDRVIAAGGSRARALLTARLNLGAAPGQLMQVTGLPLNDFTEYVLSAAAAVKAPLPTGQAREAAVRRLHEASNGSPLFAASILRLLALGEPMTRAIQQYRGADGEEVRKFAFERELENLTDSQLRLLFAALHLKNCSIAELIEATMNNRTLVRDDVAVLRNYHLMSFEAPGSHLALEDPLVTVPSEIAAMSDIIRRKIPDPNRIESNCAGINRAAGSGDNEAARLIKRVLNFWTADDFPSAVEAAEYASRKVPKNPDVWCMLGRAYLKGAEPDATKADAALRKATELSCQRPELLPLRLDAKKALGDWIGIVTLLEGEGERLNANNTLALAAAHRELGDEQDRQGNSTAAENHYRRGAKAIQQAFEEYRAHGLVEPLKALKSDLMIAYVSAVARRVVRGDDKIEIWDAAAMARQFSVHNRGVMTVGINAAVEWAQTAARRERASHATLHRIFSIKQILQQLSLDLDNHGPGWLPVKALADRSIVILTACAMNYESRLA